MGNQHSPQKGVRCRASCTDGQDRQSLSRDLDGGVYVCLSGISWVDCRRSG